jgi:hypothetical protein
MAFVEKAMAETPDIASKDLFEKTKASLPEARELNIRQFHARYPLQVKRKASLAEGGTRRRRRKGAGRRRKARKGATPTNRDAVRNALLKFATDLSSAEDRGEVVKVLARVDTYVDNILEAAGS